MAGEVVGQRVAGDVERGEPQARGCQVGREQRRARAALELERFAGAPAGEARAVAAQLDDPAIGAAVGVRRRDVQAQLAAVGAPGGQCGGQRRGGVDDEHVARPQVRREVADPRVDEGGAVRPVGGHEHPHLVAAQAADLRWLVRRATLGRRRLASPVRRAVRRCGRPRRGAHVPTPASSAAR